jgi:glycosyltransferase involved in cell wall biosynthesis
MSTTPRVSFIVASYNYARYVTLAIDSLLNQTFKELEVIVIDDCSPDNSREVLERYRDDPRVRLIFHEQNKGHIYTRNEGLELARGEYVAVMDSDDYCYRDDAVAAHVAVLDDNPDVGFVYSAYELVDENSEPYRRFHPWEHDFVRDGLDEFRELIFRNYIPHTGTLVRRAVLDTVGEHYDPSLPHSADWDLWLRLATRSQVGYLATAYYAYRIHRASMTVSRHSPHQINGEFLNTVLKGFAALPASAPSSVRDLRRPAIQQALLNTTWGDRSHGRTRRAWQGLLSAAWRAPFLLTAPKFHSSLVRLTLLTLVGHRRYERLSQLARSRKQQELSPA